MCVIPVEEQAGFEPALQPMVNPQAHIDFAAEGRCPTNSTETTHEGLRAQLIQVTCDDIFRFLHVYIQ